MLQDFPVGYVAMCVIVKNQAADLQEWLQYHRFIGVEKVYLYDNNSTVGYSCAPKAEVLLFSTPWHCRQRTA
jgi:hypothetical protein